jgi:hypothetical protein
VSLNLTAAINDKLDRNEKIDHLRDYITAAYDGNVGLCCQQEAPECAEGTDASGESAAQQKQGFLFKTQYQNAQECRHEVPEKQP